MRFSTFQNMSLGFILSGIALTIIILIGWVMNIFAIITIVNLPISGMFILRIVGIFVPPLGAILGIFF